MPQLLLNTIALDPTRWSPDDRPSTDLAALVPTVAAAGFRALEVWQYHLSGLDEAGVERLAEVLDAAGVTVPIVGLYPALHLDGEARAQEWATAEALVTRAARLGATAVKMFAGQLGSDQAGAEAVERSIAFTRRLATVAADHGLGLTVETHPDTLCDGVDETLGFLGAVGGGRLGVCYQPFDFASTERTVADYRALREHVVHVHLQGRRDDQMSLLDEADVDYRVVLTAFAEQGFDGALSIEFVKDCVVARPADFDLGRVLANAQRDRAFVEAAGADAGMALDV